MRGPPASIMTHYSQAPAGQLGQFVDQHTAPAPTILNDPCDLDKHVPAMN